jgi:peptide/nickel transport system permease protein
MKRARRRLLLGAVLLGALVALSAVAPAPDGPRTIDPERVFEPPSSRHPFGTDQLGRDVLARVLHGGRRSLGAGLAATAVAVALGTLLGAVAGSGRRGIDQVLARCADVVAAFPYLVGALAVLGLLADRFEPVPSALRVGLVVGVLAWPALFRYVRAEMHTLARGDLAIAARAIGARPGRVLITHLLPLALVPAIAPASFLAAGAILAEAGLSFLGLGIRPPAPSWGNLLRDGMTHLRSAWWLALFPGLFLYLTVLAFHLLGEGLRGRVSRVREAERVG